MTRTGSPAPPVSHSSRDQNERGPRIGETSSRMWMWDRLRFVAYLDIAAFHMRGEYAALGIGLPLFLILRIALGCRHPVPRPTREIVRERVRRLLVPWAAWSLLFAALEVASAARHGGHLAHKFNWRMLLYGAEHHLWFLPFAAVFGILVHVADRVTQRVPVATLIATCFAAAVLLLAVRPPWPMPYPLSQWLFGAPAIPIGLALGRILARSSSGARQSWLAVLAGGALLAASAALGPRAASGAALHAHPALRYALATAVLASAACLPQFSDRWTARVVPLLLGGYLLTRTIYNQTLLRIEARTHTEVGVALTLLLSVPLTLLIVAALRRTPLRAIL